MSFSSLFPTNSYLNKFFTEKRISDDGRAYTKQEFIAFYGNTDKWAEAGAVVAQFEQPFYSNYD